MLKAAVSAPPGAGDLLALKGEFRHEDIAGFRQNSGQRFPVGQAKSLALSPAGAGVCLVPDLTYSGSLAHEINSSTKLSF